MPDTQPVKENEAKKRLFGPLYSGVALAVVVVAALGLSVYQYRFAKGYVLIGDNLKVSVDVASTELTREKGLSGRLGLKPDEGMLFIFDRADTYAFWMKDMRFPLDLIWIKDGRIADLTTDVPVQPPGAPLPTYMPRVPVDRVIEVGAGFSQANGLRVGEPVTEHLEARR